MPNVILLEQADAEEVTGPSLSHPGAVLQPLPMADGRYYVGLEVLEDPAHAEHVPLLQSLPRADYETVVVPLLPVASTKAGR